MNRSALILIMCGSSVATSSLAAVKLENEAKRRKIKIETRKGKVADATMLIKREKPDLVVSTAVIEERDDIKVFNGVPLISTIGQEKLYDEIFATIKEMGLG